MIGKIKEIIIDSTVAGEEILTDVHAAVGCDIKAYADCTVIINGESTFVIDADEVLSLPHHYQNITSIKAQTAGVKLKIRYAV